jgi:hypothetical protein
VVSFALAFNPSTIPAEICPRAGTQFRINVRWRRSMSYKCLEIALYHTLGRLSEPVFTHEFC